MGINGSGRRPLGHAVMLLQYDVKETVIELPQAVKDRMVMQDQEATVVAIGPAAWDEEMRLGHPPRCKVGDKVVFSKYAGFGVPGKDGKLYRCVNDRDIFMAVEEVE